MKTKCCEWLLGWP